ncbi:hypothetical protein AB7783_27990 [Tardiphaga sp. 172_B4_N1_3]|uniref:hypothetical protein n=1 Tax=Tardiphaga TaxID=1395974 RepID=UPI00285D19D7|nr:hypothetical protein [Tardiphaga robiniae]MDR6662358.1 hypothetical protein [Tardiphaga robiniae]
MTKRWLGVIVSGDRVTMVDAEVPESGQITILMDRHIRLQQGDKADAYHVMHQTLRNYVKENKIDQSVVKGSAVSRQGGGKLANLHSAELRGIAICALREGGAPVVIETKAHISKTFGERKTDDYLDDDDFWKDNTTGKDLRGGSREAALLLLAVRKDD